MSEKQFKRFNYDQTTQEKDRKINGVRTSIEDIKIGFETHLCPCFTLSQIHCPFFFMAVAHIY